MRADSGFFTTVPRLGQKGAQRMIIELKNKIGATADLDLSELEGEAGDVVEALQSMGYSKAESLKAMRKVPPSIGSLEQRITWALLELGRGKGV